MAFLKHQFLLAMPNQAGTYFGDTITYLCEHNDDGALGLMVNRPAGLSVAALLEQLELAHDHVDPDIPVLEGGPVQTERGFILHTDDRTYEQSLPLGHGLVLSTARSVLAAIGTGAGPAQFLVALGYAGWGGGQLEGELMQNAWLTCPASHEILFEVPFEARIDAAARALGIDFRLMSGDAGHA